MKNWQAIIFVLVVGTLIALLISYIDYLMETRGDSNHNVIIMSMYPENGKQYAVLYDYDIEFDYAVEISATEDLNLFRGDSLFNITLRLSRNEGTYKLHKFNYPKRKLER